MQKFCTVWSCPDIFGGKRIKLSKAGYFAHSLNAYGRTGQPCPRCGRPIVRASFMNRSSHFCPHCQRPPRPHAVGAAAS